MCMGLYLMHKRMLAYSSLICVTSLALGSDTNSPDQLRFRWHPHGLHAYAHTVSQPS